MKSSLTQMQRLHVICQELAQESIDEGQSEAVASGASQECVAGRRLDNLIQLKFYPYGKSKCCTGRC